MKIVRVQYTTTKEFAEVNRINIEAIVSELKLLCHPGIQYGVYLLDDGRTFMHFDQFVDEEAHRALTSLDSFKKFDAALAKSKPEKEPQLELLTLVTSI